jgi:hypothetical protein
MNIVQGGFFSGEVKVAITLCILGEGLYLDLVLLFESSFNHTDKIFRSVIYNWLVHESYYPMNGVDYCWDKQQMHKVALQIILASRGLLIAVLVHWMD